MVTIRLEDTYTGSLLPAVKQITEVLPPAFDGQSPVRRYALSSSAAPHGIPSRISRTETHGYLMYYDRTSAAASASRTIGHRMYIEKGTYVDTWA
ncbi:MAG TPA: hypothetical protein ENO00_07865 [Deltaproteobacteria bacterium]|jgi:hypothetical protein|nr:hypothetical protein [Deltaproteobacteria bacterium]